MKKGFTLIELLVVIAIIALLSSVVLASLNSARSKAANAAIKEDLHNARSQAELVRSNYAGDNYSTVCSNPLSRNIMDSAAVVTGGTGAQAVCNPSLNAWAASAPLKINEGSNTAWCVDSNGASKGELNGLSGGVTACP